MIPLHAYHEGLGCFYGVPHDRSPVGHFEVGDKQGEIFVIVNMRNSHSKAICLEHSVSIVGQQISKRGPSNVMLVGNYHRRSGALNLCFYVAQHWILQDERKSYSVLRATPMPRITRVTAALGK